MSDDQQAGVQDPPDASNVMDNVVGTFEEWADNATAVIGTGVTKIGDAGSGLAKKTGELATSITATPVALAANRRAIRLLARQPATLPDRSAAALLTV